MTEQPSGKGTERKAKRRRRSRRHNPDGTMTLVEHLYELRYRLGLALIGIGIGAIFGFVWFGVSLGPVPSLGRLLLAPYTSLPNNLKLPGTEDKLLATAPFEQFMVRLQVGLVAGTVVFSPMWLYQLWAFITPGLYAKEKKFARVFVGAGALLFLAGAALAYYVVPEALLVLASIGSGEFVNAFTADKYLSFLLALILVFGVSFELPLLVVMLNRVGILPYVKLKKWRRGIIFGLFCFAAVATPGQDPISMCVLAGALTVLFELAVQLSRLNDRRKKTEDDWSELSDDEASPLDLSTHPEQPTPESQLAAEAKQRYDDAT
ncbi:twin-arginine translocase subunit TatC [Kutzneria viridogrisea]|uniref:Sec-independent protein translocase protein TatC n=2 Tax=Kutzneria TaxID=43356 RepID=W5W6M9_9PSEU|nr:twin-arginine translocase subunit TatC [Kutzneria albida]AHH96425.1 Sec-independent protein translocase tatC-like protein [Kutzneria albida DSM 43870]MBA8928357.1 sec-independent protein translocase protein TatC [Kutzneria viridogrisea]